MGIDRIRFGLVPALGLTQIIGYGTLYYSFSILADGMAADFGVAVEQVFAIFSLSLFVGGLTAPLIGRQLDRRGAAAIMTLGSAIAAATLALCAWSPSVAVFAGAVVLLEIASGMVQYQAAFAALVERDPGTASRNITYLTLIAGFASSIFWPISTALKEHLSWREIYLVFAALNLFVCMPMHVGMMRAGRAAAKSGTRKERPHVLGAIPAARRRSAMLTVSVAFALLGFTLTSILAHMVPMLGALGLGGAAVVIGSLFGPAQVLSRLINMVFGTRLSPAALAVLSAGLMVTAVLILAFAGKSLPAAIAFAVCLGLGSGNNSIAQGSLPLYLFGSDGYGAVTGRMAAAPFAFAAAMHRIGIGPSLLATAALGTLGMAAFVKVARAARPGPAAPVRSPHDRNEMAD